ncbi:MAG TPA: hypothetical protein VJN92_19600 [Candidatus Acidoferrum sp.]|nr:hypothetical protein [Candidatus Acidoferrum sp.]
MVRIGGHDAINSYGGTLTRDFAYFSPDGKQFAVILKRGDLETNANEYSLVVFEADKVFHNAKPRTVVRMSSSSNREGINDVVWLSDNDTMLFLGQRPGEDTQLYSVSCRSGGVRKLTNHPTNLIAFSSDVVGERIVYAAEKPRFPVVNAKSLREGITITNEAMSEILGGSVLDEERELVSFDSKSGASRRLALGADLHGEVWGDIVDFSLSPDGWWLAVKTNLTEVPADWWQYREPLLKRFLRRELPPGSLSWIFRYALIETKTGRSRVLLDSPVSYSGSEVAWSPDGRSVVLTGVSLPIHDPQLSPELRGSPAVVEVALGDLSYRMVTSEDLRYLWWNGEKNVVAFEKRQSGSEEKPRERQCFRKEGEQWVADGSPAGEQPSLRVTEEEDLNAPPKIVVFDPSTRQKATVLDLNPQFGELEFGKVQEIRFFGAGHGEVRAGLYFPPDYASGRKYPLVVQTHGFDAHGFWIDGPFTTAFAAEALAARGMLVLQVPDRHDESTETPNEAPGMMETIENAIAYVDGLGILDRERIGIVGFSRTGLYVFYMLTHSKIHFRAAVVADGSDGGYSQYLQFLDAHPYTASDSESINGGLPFGSGLLYWLRRSPEFLLDTVDTPLMIQAASHESLSMLWADFKGLRRLGKPVELIYLPTGTHILQKPWDRMVSGQGTVDWCAFWLKGEEDGRLEKVGKYARWRRMRDSQTASQSRLE